MLQRNARGRGAAGAAPDAPHNPAVNSGCGMYRRRCSGRRGASRRAPLQSGGSAWGCPNPETWGLHVPQTETFRWARCKEAAPLPRLQRVGLPLPEALLDVLEPALAWEDLQVRTGHTTLQSWPGMSLPMLCSCAVRQESALVQHLAIHVGVLCLVFGQPEALKDRSLSFNSLASARP